MGGTDLKELIRECPCSLPSGSFRARGEGSPLWEMCHEGRVGVELDLIG